MLHDDGSSRASDCGTQPPTTNSCTIEGMAPLTTCVAGLTQLSWKSSMKTEIPVTTDEERPRASFTSMADGTASDWNIIGSEFVRFAGDLPDRVLAHLAMLA